MQQETIDFKWLSSAWVTALMSKDPSTKVGAVIVSADNRKSSTGFNGFPAGVVETPELWERPTKYEYVQHAEPNAIANCSFDRAGSTIYVTHRPCHRCLGLIANAGIDHIVYNLDYDRVQDNEAWDDISKVFKSIRKVDRNIRQEIVDQISNLRYK